MQLPSSPLFCQNPPNPWKLWHDGCWIEYDSVPEISRYSWEGIWMTISEESSRKAKCFSWKGQWLDWINSIFLLVENLALALSSIEEQRKGFAGFLNTSKWSLSVAYLSELPFQVLIAAFKPSIRSSNTWQYIDACGRISSSWLAEKGDWWFYFTATLGGLWGKLFSHICIQLLWVYQFPLSIKMILILHNKSFQGSTRFTKAVAKALQGTWWIYRLMTYH